MIRTKILFNKNHISIKQFDKDPNANFQNSLHIHNTGDGRVKKPNEYETVKVKKISKIAPFYYETEERHLKKSLDNAIRKETVKKFIRLYSKHYGYEISYFTGFGDTKVGIETRPWDICPGDGAFEEHFIKDLEKVIKDIFLDVDINNIVYDIYYSDIYRYNNTKYNGQNLKVEIMNDLFADKDGYKQQTNEGKILSHGFDLKESFRKRKTI